MPDLFVGILLMFLVGLCWTGSGVIVSTNARRNVNTALMIGVNTIAICAVCMVILGRQGKLPLDFSGYFGLTHLFMFTCGFFNLLAFVIIEKAMKLGNNGIVWSFIQSALIWPFAMGILIFGVEPRWTRLLGVAVVLVGVLMMGFTKSSREDGVPSSRRWLWGTILGFLVAGWTQCLGNVPSYWEQASQMSSVEKTLTMQLGNLVGCIALKWRSVFSKSAWNGLLVPVIVYTAFNILNQFFFYFNGLQKLTDIGAGSIAYPIGMGVCISGVFLYSACVLREKTSALGFCALAACLSGIIIISC